MDFLSAWNQLAEEGSLVPVAAKDAIVSLFSDLFILYSSPTNTFVETKTF
jgi:hypothetical protein